MRMDPSIILSGRPVNALGALSAGTQAGVQAGEAQQRGNVLSLYREQGPAIMQGDPNAMNALASIAGPQEALGVQQTQQALRINEENLELARAEGARAAQRFQMEMDANELAQEVGQIRQYLPRAQSFIDGAMSGEIDERTALMGLNEIFSLSPDLPAANSIEEAAITVAGFDGFVGQVEGGRALMGAGPEGDMSAAEAAIARMESIGIPRDIAIRIEDGVFDTARDPVTQELTVVDLATGGVVFRIDQDGNTIRSGGQAGQQPAAEAGQAGQQPAAETPALTFGGQSRNAEDAFGLRGMAAGAANTVSDFLGFGEVAPEVAENQRFFRTYEEDALVFLAQAYPRQPAQALMERIRSLVPNVGTMEGAGRAVGELQALRDRFASDLESVERNITRGRLSPSDRAQANDRASALREMLARTEEAISRFGGGGNAGDFGGMDVDALLEVDPSTLSQEQRDAYEARLDALLSR